MLLGNRNRMIVHFLLALGAGYLFIRMYGESLSTAIASLAWIVAAVGDLVMARYTDDYVQNISSGREFVFGLRRILAIQAILFFALLCLSLKIHSRPCINTLAMLTSVCSIMAWGTGFSVKISSIIHGGLPIYSYRPKAAMTMLYTVRFLFALVVFSFIVPRHGVYPPWTIFFLPMIVPVLTIIYATACRLVVNLRPE